MMQDVSSVSVQLRTLSDRLDQQIRAAQKASAATSIASLERHVQEVQGWRNELLPRSKQDIVVELSNRLFPLAQTLLDVVREQQSRIRVLEHHVLERQHTDSSLGGGDASSPTVILSDPNHRVVYHRSS